MCRFGAVGGGRWWGWEGAAPAGASQPSSAPASDSHSLELPLSSRAGLGGQDPLADPTPLALSLG